MPRIYSQFFTCWSCQEVWERKYEVGSHIPVIVPCDKCGKETAYATENARPRPKDTAPVRSIYDTVRKPKA